MLIVNKKLSYDHIIDAIKEKKTALNTKQGLIKFILGRLKAISLNLRIKLSVCLSVCLFYSLIGPIWLSLIVKPPPKKKIIKWGMYTPLPPLCLKIKKR